MSTVPAVLAALVALAEATLNSDEFQVIDGPPDAETQRTQRVFAIGDAEIVATAEVDSYGGASMAERYTVPFTVSVALPGADVLITARTEAYAALEDFGDAVRGAVGRNLGLGAQFVIDAVPSTEQRYQPFATPEGRSVAVRAGVDIYAQLT